MGFLKELFEKKLKTAGKEYDEQGLEIGRSAQSEWALPALRVQHTGKLSGSTEDSSSGYDNDGSSSDMVCYLQTQQSAKSFTAATTRKQQLEHAERLHAATQQPARWQTATRIKYDSISQFSQKVELYRGSVATVFKAVCAATNMKVIIKAYYKQKMHPKHIHKLHREISAMRSLNGPYVAEFYATFEDLQCMYIVMEFCEGGDLFKTMLMHGGLLDEQWVCVEVIKPLLRILEKMHSLKLLHRDIKPENIFLTALGKFKLGDFGLAIKFDEEVPFSRSGTLDYMAPEVLKNPSVPFQEGRSVDVATLAAKGVKPYGPPVDVWAAGVLAYELVCGRPPFEVEDEAQTAALIMYSDAIKFPPNRTPQWTDFVKSALIKNPDVRPTASALLKHAWIVTNLQRTLSEQHRPSKELLLQPLPLSELAAGKSKDLKRNTSMAAAANGSGHCSAGKESDAGAGLAPLPLGGVPCGLNPALPAACPATPTGAARQLQHLHLGFGEKDLSSSSSSSSAAAGSGVLRPSSLSIVTSSSGLSAHSSSSFSALVSPSPASAAAAERLRDIQAVIGSDGSRRPGAVAEPGPGGLLPSPRGASFTSGACDRPALSPLGHPAAASPSSAATVGAIGSGTHSPSMPAGSRSNSITGSGSGTSPMHAPPRLGPPAGLSLKVTLPPETEFELCGSSDSFCYSPTTPAPKPGIKERMKLYFQRQAGSGASGGF